MRKYVNRKNLNEANGLSEKLADIFNICERAHHAGLDIIIAIHERCRYIQGSWRYSVAYDVEAMC